MLHQKTHHAKGMVITQTPCRISFLGGGTDFPEYFNTHAPAPIIGAAVNKYVYVTLNSLERLLDKRILLSYSKLEKVDSPAHLEHDLVRAILGTHAPIDDGVFLDIHTYADLPSSSGLGSSSAFTVGMLNAWYLLAGTFKTPKEIAQEAIHVERVLLGHNGGWQDQVFSAHGGLNVVRFRAEGFDVEPLCLPVAKERALEESCLLFFSNSTRSSAQVQQAVAMDADGKRNGQLDTLAAHAEEGLEVLRRSRSVTEMVTEFGALVSKSWETKRAMAPGVTSPVVDQMYEKAISAGAAGGKLCGAGGGGFLLVVVPETKRDKVLCALADFPHVPVNFDHRGSVSVFARKG